MVEGYMDVVGLSMKGVKNVVACCGTAMTEQHVKRFAGVCNRVHLLFDGDSAGRNAAAKSFMVARNADIDVTACFLPDEIDPDDFARQHGEGVGRALQELPKAELLDVYIDGLLGKVGCALGEKPGPNLLGKLCDEVAKAVAVVEREVVRSSFLTRAARRLGVEVPQIGRLVDEIRRKAGAKVVEGASPPAPSAAPRGVVPVEEATAPRQSRQPAKLPRIDLDILRSVMVLKGDVLTALISNAEVCGLIQPETLQFIMTFRGILDGCSDDEAHQRQAVKEYLESLGAGWVGLWKEAYKMAKADVSMQELYRVSLLGLRREKLRVLMEECKQELLTGGDDPQRQLEISERIRALKSQLDAYGRGVDLTPPNS